MSTVSMYPRVSVLILTYNSSAFIAESIDSVLLQDYKNIQIVVSDDASCDSTQEILNKYAKKHPGIFVINLNKVNLGITKNANVALALCNGDFVAFHAGDDIMLPGKLAAQVAYFESHSECVLCYHNLELFDSNTGRSIGHYNKWNNPAREGTVMQLIKYGCFIGGNSVMVRKRHLPSGGYNESFPVASDWSLWIAVTLGGGKIGYIDRVLARYRRHSANTTAVTSPLNSQAILDALNTTNWIMVNHPTYAFKALKGYSIHLRLLRRLDGGRNYVEALLSSIKVWPTIPAVGALLVYLFTFGKVRL